VQTHLGTALHEDAQDVPEVQEPILEHAPNARDQEQEGVNGHKPRLLDLFCCAGGASVGYSEAGFEVVGVDIKPQPNYPFEFVEGDALALDPNWIASFDAVHASPPCQAYSDLAKRNGSKKAG
jgi:hypothetical protein